MNLPKQGDRPSVSKVNLKRASLSALVWSVAEKWGAHIFSLGVFLLLARLLGPEEFGLVAMAGVYIVFAQVFVDQGLSSALVQREPLTSSHLNSAFWFSVALGIVLTLISWLLAPVVANIFDEPALIVVLRWLSFVLVVNSLSGVHVALFQRRLEFKPLAVRTLIATLVSGIVAIIMALQGFGVWSLVAQQLVAATLKLGLLWLQSPWRPALEFSFSAMKELMSFSLNMLGNNLVEFGNRQFDKLIVGYFLGPVILGYYVVAYRVYKLLLVMLSGAVGQVAFSSFSAIQSDHDRVRSTFYNITRMGAFIAWPVFAVVAIYASSIVGLLLDEQWNRIVPILQILLIAGALECILTFNASVFYALDKAHWRFYIGLINTLVSIVMMLISVHYGLIYIALSHTIRIFALSPLPLYLIKKLIGLEFRQYLLGLWPSFFGVVLVLVVGKCIYYFLPMMSPIYILSIGLTISVTAYILTVWLIEKELVISGFSMVRNLKGRT